MGDVFCDVEQRITYPPLAARVERIVVALFVEFAGVEYPVEVGVVGEGGLDYFDCVGDVGFGEGEDLDC